jgi:hypothetical protein
MPEEELPLRPTQVGVGLVGRIDIGKRAILSTEWIGHILLTEELEVFASLVRIEDRGAGTRIASQHVGLVVIALIGKE